MKKRMHGFKGFIGRYRWFSFALGVSVFGLALQLGGWSAATNWALGITCSVVALVTLFGMIRDLRDGTYGVDLLAITAIVTAVVMKEYWTAMVIVLMLTGGEALEDYAENRAKREMTALLDNAPRKAHLLRGSKTIDVSVKDVKMGDKIIIRAGEVVPVDAVILDGSANFDEASLTGESIPEERKKGDEILSGAVSMDGTVTARALRASSESQYEQILKLVRQAAASKAPFVRMADRFAIPFTLIAFVIAGGAWFLSGDSLRFLQVMVVATPCPLILAAPIAIISGMSRASKQGVIVKNGTALEKVAGAKSFAFDKTGTLTHGKLAVAEVVTYNGYSKIEVLMTAAALGKLSNHITSQAIVQHATAKGVKPMKVKQSKEFAGKGMQASFRAKTYFMGRPSFLADKGVKLQPEVIKLAESQTSTLLASDEELIGVILFADELRADAKSTIEYLRQHGVEDTYLITGDNEAVALAVAKQVGIPKKDVVAQALPVDKLRTIERVAKPPVAFVGDGVNDAPVLVAADVGIALGAKGSTAASESADIVIMKDSFSKVVDIHAIARRTFRIARQSIWVGIGLSVALMVVFATGKFKPIVGAAVQEIVDVIVIFNALRAHIAGKE